MTYAAFYKDGKNQVFSYWVDRLNITYPGGHQNALNMTREQYENYLNMLRESMTLIKECDLTVEQIELIKSQKY